MSLNRFFAYSFIFHVLLILAAVILIPQVKEKNTGGEFFTRLVSPEELLPPKHSAPALPRVKPVPQSPSPTVRRPPASGKPGRNLPGEGLSSAPSHPSAPSSTPSAPLAPPISPSLPSEGKAQAPQVPSPSVKPGPAPSLREKLFDKNIIGDIVKRDIEKKDKEKKGKTFTLDTSEYKFLVYNERLRERIESIWKYPPEAASRGIYGDLIIKFTIKKNGELGGVELVRTSGHKDLDDAAIRALKEGAPYWPLPDEWNMDAYTIEGRFIYTIYGYYIR